MSLLRIDEIFNFEKGVLQSSKCVPGEFDFITASSDWKTHNEYTHECEALIFAAAASGSLGRTHYVNGKFISSDLCFIITPKDQKNLPVDLKFYHILFNELKDEIVRNTKAGTSKEAIGLGSFGRYQLPYFDIDTQIEIKNRFVYSEVLKSDLSNELNHQVELVKKLRQQLLQDAVQGKLVEQNKKDEPGSELLNRIKAEKAKLIAEKKLKKEKELPPIKPDEIPFEIPENWVWCRLGEICDYEQGIQVDVHLQKSVFEESLIRFLRIVDYTQETDDLRYIKSPGLKYHIQEDELVMVRYGATAGYVGTGKAGVLANNLFKVKYGTLSKHYLTYFFNSKYFNSELAQNTKGVAMPAISFKFLDNLLFPLPPLAEQNLIVQKLDELIHYCNELEASIKESETQNEKLLQQVLREALRKEPVEV